MALLHSAFRPDTDIDPINGRILRTFNVFLRTFNCCILRTFNCRNLSTFKSRILRTFHGCSLRTFNGCILRNLVAFYKH